METREYRTVDEYINGFPDDVQGKLREMRRIIREAAPEAREKISYRMPCYFQNGNLVYFGAHENHIGFYPTPSGIRSFTKEISPYKTSKGAIQLPLSEPLPETLIKKIVRFRVKENSAR